MKNQRNEGYLTHQATIRRGGREIYDFLAHIEEWPLVFPPTVHAEVLSTHQGPDDTHNELIKIWATGGNALRSWESTRVLDPVSWTIDFHQVERHPCVEYMRGRWTVQRIDANVCRVQLEHWFAVVDTANLPWVKEVIDENSTKELSALAEYFGELGETLRVLRFADSVPTANNQLDAAFAFIVDAGRWPERLNHVRAVELEEDDVGQSLSMSTGESSGEDVRTHSWRVIPAPGVMLYKQDTKPAFMFAHLGRWTATRGEPNGLLRSEHTIILQGDADDHLLGSEIPLDAAEGMVREAIGGNSRKTLSAAVNFLEATP